MPTVLSPSDLLCLASLIIRHETTRAVNPFLLFILSDTTSMNKQINKAFALMRGNHKMFERKSSRKLFWGIISIFVKM